MVMDWRRSMDVAMGLKEMTDVMREEYKVGRVWWLAGVLSRVVRRLVVLVSLLFWGTFVFALRQL